MHFLSRLVSCYKVFTLLGRSRVRCSKLTWISVFTALYLWCAFVLFRQRTTAGTRVLISAYDDLKCGCPRSYRASRHTWSLCGASSSGRGEQQRVVAYSVYGPFSSPYHYTKYWHQVEQRILDVTEKYPGWTMRLYHNITKKDKEPHQFLCGLYCKYPNLDPCNAEQIFPETNSIQNNSQNFRGIVSIPYEHISNEIMSKVYAESSESPELKLEITPHIGSYSSYRSERSSLKMKNFRSHEISAAFEHTKKLTKTQAKEKSPSRSSYGELLVPSMWRFLPMADPSVAVFLVRDVDSAVLAREVAAVRQWLERSQAVLHVMRDHPSHNGAILAGMWGGSRIRGSTRLEDLFQKMLRWPPRQLWDYDQRLLQRVVWPEIKDSVVIHDSYLCRNKRFTANHPSLPFPTQRVNKTFVSWGILRDHEKEGIVPCPKACRPQNHKDWTYC